MQVCTVYVYVAITFRSVVLFIYKMTYNVLRDVKKYHTIPSTLCMGKIIII